MKWAIYPRNVFLIGFALFAWSFAVGVGFGLGRWLIEFLCLYVIGSVL